MDRKSKKINEASTSRNNYSEDVLLVSSSHQTAVATRTKKNAYDVVFQQTLEMLGALNEKLVNEQQGNKENEFGNFVGMELSGIRDVELLLEAKQEITNIIFNYKRKWISQYKNKIFDVAE
ncbi:hypothetical protein FQA39_LY17098 [Lamprigera yunnana]|nr:hypothetical protein FQA39_LY17098 [Lamprigera yunnana]